MEHRSRPTEPARVHLLRHGESTFNAGLDVAGNPHDVDARLTDLGRTQAVAAARRVRSLRVDLVVSSPLTRALQTSEIVADGRIPIVVEPLLREWQVNGCDVGRAPSVLRSEFPALSFDRLTETWWYEGDGNDSRDERGLFLEPPDAFFERVLCMSQWLRAAPEGRLLLVGHHAHFLRLAGRGLRNCELVPLSDSHMQVPVSSPSG